MGRSSILPVPAFSELMREMGRQHGRSANREAKVLLEDCFTYTQVFEDPKLAALAGHLFPPVHCVGGPCVKTAPDGEQFAYTPRDITCHQCQVFWSLAEGEIPDEPQPYARPYDEWVPADPPTKSVLMFQTRRHFVYRLPLPPAFGAESRLVMACQNNRFVALKARGVKYTRNVDKVTCDSCLRELRDAE